MANPRQTPAHAMALLDQVVAAYGPGESRHPSLQAIGKPLGLNPLQVRKLLITAGVYKSAKAERVLALYREGKTVEEIVERTGLSRVSVYTYLPYTRGVRPEEPEEDPADRAEREREAAVRRLAAEPTAENLWAALLLFQSCPFHTAKGLEFSYTIKGGELFVSRKEKSITRSSVEMAFRRALALGGGLRPQEAGGVRGAVPLSGVPPAGGHHRREEELNRASQNPARIPAFRLDSSGVCQSVHHACFFGFCFRRRLRLWGVLVITMAVPPTLHRWNSSWPKGWP